MDIKESMKPILFQGKTYASAEGPRSSANANLLTISNIKSNNDYRNYLTNFADLIILKNQMSSCDEVGLCPAKFNNGQSSVNKHMYSSVYDNNKPYGYENSDLKESYIKKQKDHYL